MENKARDPESAESRFIALDRQLDSGEAQPSDMLDLARICRREHEDIDLTFKMYLRASRAGDFEGADVTLKRVAAHEAWSLARKARRTDLMAVARMQSLSIDMNTGDHRDAFDGLLAMATSPQARTLPVKARVHMFIQLALACSTSDHGDSVSLCLQMAEFAEASGSTPLPLSHAVWIQSIRFSQALYSHPIFDKSLRPFKLAESQRRLLLQRIVQRLAPRVHEADQNTSHWVRHQMLCTLPLAEALLSGNAADLDMASQRFRALMDDRPAEEEQGLLRVISCYLLLGRPQEALSMITQVKAEDPRSVWQERLQWLYLRYAVARECGLTQESLRWYERYLHLAVELTPRIEFNTARLQRRLSGLKECQSVAENPVFRPLYLDRAVQLLESDGAPATIASVARAVGVSERALRSAFISHLGVGPKHFAIQCRLDAARLELESGSAGVSIGSLADRFGFSNASRFSSAYRKRFGHSPVAHRTG